MGRWTTVVQLTKSSIGYLLSYQSMLFGNGKLHTDLARMCIIGTMKGPGAWSLKKWYRPQSDDPWFRLLTDHQVVQTTN